MTRRDFFRTTVGAVLAAALAPLVSKPRPDVLVEYPPVTVGYFDPILTPEMRDKLIAAHKGLFQPFHDPAFRKTFYEGKLGDGLEWYDVTPAKSGRAVAQVMRDHETGISMRLVKHFDLQADRMPQRLDCILGRAHFRRAK